MEGKTIIENFLKKWHECVGEKNIDKVEKLISNDVKFISPVVYKLKTDKIILLKVLTWILEIIKDFNYIQTFYNYEDLTIVLLFEGKIIERKTGRLIDVQGVDLIKLNKEGLLTELRVMVRPLNATLELAEEMKGRFLKLSSKF